jgi:hypothetical protein
VITSVAEQTSPHFDSVARDHLAVIRFPLYYKFGFALHALAIPAAICAVVCSRSKRARRMSKAALGLVLLSGVLMILDHQFVYKPLEQLVTPAGKARTSEFIRLHKYSTYANTAHLAVILAASVVISWPVSRMKSSSATDDTRDLGDTGDS